jgi:hypothetical protein
MITLITGKLGGGKSYKATRDIWRHIVQGRDVYANWSINFDDYFHHRTTGWRGVLWLIWIKVTFANEKFGKVYYWDTLDQLYTLRNGEVYMDEAHMSVNARDFSSLPPKFRTKLTQSRKYGLNLYFITQHSAQIDVSIRRLSNAMQKVRNIFSKLFIWKEWDGEFIDVLANPEMMAIKTPKSQAQGLFIFNKHLANAYNTMQLFDPFDPYDEKPMWQVPYKKMLKDDTYTTHNIEEEDGFTDLLRTAHNRETPPQP